MNKLHSDFIHYIPTNPFHILQRQVPSRPSVESHNIGTGPEALVLSQLDFPLQYPAQGNRPAFQWMIPNLSGYSVIRRLSYYSTGIKKKRKLFSRTYNLENN